MGYPEPSKVDQSNTAMFQSVHKKAGPAGLVSFLSLMLTLLCIAAVLYLGSVSVFEIFTIGESTTMIWTLLATVLGALFLAVSLLCAIVGAIEGSGWAAATIGVFFIPIVAGAFYVMGTVGAVLVALLFSS